MKYSTVKHSRCPHCGRRRRAAHFERRIVEWIEPSVESQIEVERAARIDKLIEICMSLLPQLRAKLEKEMLEALRAGRAEALENERAMLIEASRQARVDKLLDMGLS